MRYKAIIMAAGLLSGLSNAYAMSQTPEDKNAQVVETLRARPVTDEVIYFVLPDRFANGDPGNDTGGITGDRLTHGFDPTHKGFYHGGDLKGLTAKLDYIQGMGVTAIWFAPVFKNKPVQGPKGNESAGYHGYWVTDFTSIDPHFGTNDEFKAFVDAAHARGMKVYMDIITNHTADIIGYKEGEASGFTYRSKADYPFTKRGGANGPDINTGFAGEGNQSKANWTKLTDPSFAYTPVVPEAERNVKIPTWLNDPAYYHNRGNSNWVGESSLYGDFVGLDDLATEHPRVVEGFIEIYGSWIDRFGIDGFRIDTVKHVNPEFWQAFVPAIEARAKAKGIPNFHLFAEIAHESPDAVIPARFMKDAHFPSALDFGFAKAAQITASGAAGSDVLANLLMQDSLYPGEAKTALTLPTFLGNHDFGRFAMFIKKANPSISADELLGRVKLGNAMMMTLRGVPVIYYGDEQGFISDDIDQLARENMFPSKVDAYNDNDLVGTDATTADDNFDVKHPLYQQIALLSKLRLSEPALMRGESKIRNFSDKPGLLAVSRFDPKNKQEILLLFNSSNAAITANIEVNFTSAAFTALAGNCPQNASAQGSVAIDLAPLSYAVCKATNIGASK